MSSLYHNKTSLFDSFTKANKEDWIKQASLDLASKDFDKLLLGKTVEGIPMYPFYTDGVKRANFVNFFQIHDKAYSPKSWELQEVIRIDDEVNLTDTNRLALHILEQGVESICFDCTFLDTDLNTSILLKDILLEGVSICWKFDSGKRFDKLYFPENIRGSIYLHVIEKHIDKSTKKEQGIENLSTLLEQDLPQLKKLGVNAWQFSNSGASVIQELGLTCNLVVEYLDHLTNLGHPADHLFNNLEVTLGTRSAYFVDIAKFRAMQHLLHQLAKCYEVEYLGKFPLRAVSSLYNKSAYDIHANMLRNTSEAMAAILGGCSQISILPHDLQYAPEYSFSRRITRNVSHILRHEAHLDLVHNPVDGSYALDELTTQITEKAWAYFLEIENAGGLLTTFQNGKVEQDIAAYSSKIMEEVGCQQKVFVGSNRYVDPNIRRSKSAADFFNKIKGTDGILKTINLPSVIENIRAQVDRKVAEGKSRPTIGLLSIDEKANPAIVNIRYSFVQDILHSVGIYSEQVPDTLLKMKHPSNSLEKFHAVVLVSDDTIYVSLKEEDLNQKIKKYRIPFLLAGLPQKIADRRQEHGIFEFIYKGMNLPAFADKFFKRIKF
ncbi:methylmalonyl-CoA mutase family protein [Catalinimonas sp. 4WD22]|uniref:methylmalonyl-CoA mutase family protein n=1 Tax=Catalinimonas locisalis TaxID=3133978 RepID=UPI00310186D3